MKRNLKQTAMMSLAVSMILGAGMAPRAEASAKPVKPVFEPKVVEVGRPVPVRPEYGRRGRSLRAKVWTDAGEGAVLYPGESVRVFFRVSRDAFVKIYDVEPNGRVSVLFPSRYDDGFVRGGVTVTLPDHRDPTRLVVRGRPGIERIVIVASNEPYRGGLDLGWTHRARTGEGEYTGLGDVLAGGGAWESEMQRVALEMGQTHYAGGRGKPRVVREIPGYRVSAETLFVVGRRRLCWPRW